ncbi:hypothetical protein RYX36_002369 [Vicia faba]
MYRISFFDSLLIYVAGTKKTSHQQKFFGFVVEASYVNHKNGSSSQDSEFDSLCLSDIGLAALADRFPKLEKLRLIWCSNDTSHGLSSLAWKCVYLKALDLRVNLLSFISLEHL